MPDGIETLMYVTDTLMKVKLQQDLVGLEQ